MLPGPSASEVTTLWRYTNLFIIIIIIIIVARAKWCHVLSTAAHRPSWRVDSSDRTQLMTLPLIG